MIAQLPDRLRLLAPVCESMADPATRRREVTALQEAMSEPAVSDGIIVTRHEEEQIEAGPGTIEVVPVWRFLLRFQEPLL